MDEYSEEHMAIAIDVLSRAHAELVERGLTEVEALHAMAHAAVDWMGEYCCAGCLATEYSAILEATEDRLKAIPETETAQPGAVH